MTKDIEPGSQFGRWIVLERVGSDKRGMSIYLCQCDCSRRIEVLGQNLRSGMSRQCRPCSQGQPLLTVPQLHALRVAKETVGYKHGTYAKFARTFGVSAFSIKRAWRAL